MWLLKAKKPASFRAVWIVAALVVLLKAAFVLLTSIRGIASITWLIDDSFIEMKIARNLALGFGFSLDQIHPTSGAPFLWIYLSSINHLLFSLNGAIRATLIETAVLGGLATVVVFALAHKLTGSRRIAWTAFLLSTFTANAFIEALNGMDTALFTFLVVLTIALFLDVGRPKQWGDLAWGSLTGLVAGLAVMTRGDGVFLIGTLVLVKVLQWWRNPTERRLHARFLAGFIVVAAVCFGVFMTWQLVRTGSPLPGNQVGRRELALALHGFSFEHFSLWQYLTIVGWNVFELESLLAIAMGGSAIALAAFAMGCARKDLCLLGVICLLYCGTFFVVLVAYQWYFADLHGLRYINPAVHLFTIFIATLLWQLPVDRWKKPVAVTLTVCLLVLAGYKFYQMSSRFKWAPYMSMIGRPDLEKNREFWGTIDWIQTHLPAGTLIGVRDYGRISLFTDMRIQDIAGNVDPDAAAALNSGTLKQYLHDRGVNYLYIPTLEQRSDELYQYLHRELRLVQVKDAPVSPTQTLYSIAW